MIDNCDFDTANDEMSKKLASHTSVKRQSDYQDHNMLISPEIRRKAKEGIVEYDCSANMTDRWCLAKV